MDKKDILEALNSEDSEFIRNLFKRAYQVKLDNVGCRVYFRGIIEFSNICEKDCLYCGIRKGNRVVKRFSMPAEEIVETAVFAYKCGYGSVVLQSGERSDKGFVWFIEKVLKEIKRRTNNRLGITLSLGEQSLDTFQRWFKAGAHRYLLRIETSNKFLYQRLHPVNHDYNKRLECLGLLRHAGYQVGTGVMIGLPYQTCNDLAEDIMFFQDQDIDMIGMGPFIVHKDTPLYNTVGFNSEKNFSLGLKMIALTRLYLKDVNIAATTALQTLDIKGRQAGLKAGANIIMPNITPLKYRRDYQLYQGKPCLDESGEQGRARLESMVEAIGEDIGYNQWGDAPHFVKRKGFALG
jgi:biotin synthase